MEDNTNIKKVVNMYMYIVAGQMVWLGQTAGELNRVLAQTLPKLCQYSGLQWRFTLYHMNHFHIFMSLVFSSMPMNLNFIFPQAVAWACGRLKKGKTLVLASVKV